MTSVPQSGIAKRERDAPRADTALTGNVQGPGKTSRRQGGGLRLLLLLLALLLLLSFSSSASSAVLAPRSGVVGAPSHPPPPSVHLRVERSAAPRAPPADAARLGAPAIVPPSDGWLLTQGDPERNGTSVDPEPFTSNIVWNTTVGPTNCEVCGVEAGLVSWDGIVYAPSLDGSVYALNATTGAILWSYTTHDDIVAAPALDQGLLLITSQDGDLYAINATTGALTGTIPLDLPAPELYAGPLPVGPDVVTPCQAHALPSLCEFVLASGSQLWSVPVGILQAPPSEDPSTGLVFTANSTGGVSAVWLSNGTLAWSYSFGTDFTTSSSPVVGDDGPSGRPMVYSYASASTTSGYLAAFNETNRTPILHPYYRDPFSFGLGSSTPTLTSTALIFATETGFAISVDPATGALNWQGQPWSGKTNEICASPLDASGVLLVGEPSSANCNGGGSDLAEVWASNGSFDRDVSTSAGSILGSFALTDTALYFGTSFGSVYAVGVAPPTAPLDLVAAPGNQSLSVGWKAPASFEGDALIQYSVAWGLPTGQLLTTTVSPTTLQYTITGLTNGEAYRVFVEAVNGEGAGPQTETNATPGSVPYPPQNVELRLLDHEVELTWTPPANTGGSAISQYLVSTWNASDTTPVSVSLPGTATSWEEGDLTNGVVVFAEVAAHNSWGTGANSSVVSGAPYVAPAVMVIEVDPASVRASVVVTVQSVGVAIPAGNGSVRLVRNPGTYWVNASAPGYGAFDEQVKLGTGETVPVNITLQKPATNPLNITTTDLLIITVVIIVVILVGIFLVSSRYRRLQEEAGEGGEEEAEEEGAAPPPIRQPVRPAAGEEEEEEEEALPGPEQPFEIIAPDRRGLPSGGTPSGDDEEEPGEQEQ